MECIKVRLAISYSHAQLLVHTILRTLMYQFFSRSFICSALGINPLSCSGNSFTNLYSATPKGAFVCFKVYSTTMLFASLHRMMPNDDCDDQILIAHLLLSSRTVIFQHTRV